MTEIAASSGRMGFWEHLDELRSALVRIAAVAAVFSVMAFLFKDELFAIILAPGDDGFVTYRVLDRIGTMFVGEGTAPFSVSLINTGLARQFIIHMQASLCAGVMCASPYILYQLFRFVSPALYADERRYALRVAGGGYVMFIAGVLLGYYLIFPLTFRFLGTYQVSGEVVNMISLESYAGTMAMICVAMGVVFEMPVLCWLFGRLGFLTSGFMRTYRRHAVVLILIVAAVITPTSDIFTLTLVSLPMWLLYEASIRLVGDGKAETVQ